MKRFMCVTGVVMGLALAGTGLYQIITNASNSANPAAMLIGGIALWGVVGFLYGKD